MNEAVIELEFDDHGSKLPSRSWDAGTLNFVEDAALGRFSGSYIALDWNHQKTD